MGDRLDEVKGVGPGFDFLRIGLACAIVMTHAALLSHRGWIRGTSLWYVEYALVPMFFALSGFLVTGSAMRLSLKNFLLNRGLRIIPALAVDIVICSLIIGPILTTVPLRQYFTSPLFFQYFLNIFGWIHYRLPGVFETNFSHLVNGALWTVPYEIACYIVMSALIVTGFVARPSWTMTLTLCFLVLALFVQLSVPFHMLPHIIERVLWFLLVSRGGQLIAAFLMGILVYQYRAVIPYNRVLLAISVAIVVASDQILDSSSIGSVGNRFIVLPALVYITVWLGLTPIPLPKFLHRGDYSYGIYLYHDPLLQTLILLLPLSLITGSFGWIALVVLGLAAVGCLATFSWHFIEKPILGLRKKFSFVAQIRGVDAAGTAPAKSPEALPIADQTVAADRA